MERAGAALEQRDWRLAVKAFSWPLELGAGDETACRRGRANALLALQQWEAALEDLDLLVAADDRGRDLLMMRCRARSQNGNLVGALADVDALVQRGLDPAVAANLRGEFHEFAGNQKEALKQYALAIDGDASNPRPRLNRGRLHERAGNYEAALEDYQDAIKRTARNRPDEAYPAKMGSVRILNRFKRFAEAVGNVPGGDLKSDADAVEAAFAMYGAGDALDARDWFKSAADYRPRNAAARAWQAYTESDLGRIIEGARAAEEACIEDPELDFALCARAWIAVQSNQTAPALRDCRAALALNEGCAEAWRILACCRIQRGELTEALHCARKAVSLKPGDCFCLYTLGAVLAQLSLEAAADDVRKQREDALTHLEQAFAAGLFWKTRAARDPLLAPVRDDPRFQKLIKP
jgi:tetratricopeptide (TPR) repeat protein